MFQSMMLKLKSSMLDLSLYFELNINNFIFIYILQVGQTFRQKIK